jgi:uncharacterized protein (TIGR04562 family)
MLLLQITPPLDSLDLVELTAEFRKRFEFDWEVLDVIIGGKSAIDSGDRLRIRTAEDSSRFMDCYGYDIENPIEKAELFGNFQEALSFIRRYFLQPDNPDGLKLEVPRKLAELTDISQLLILASGGGTGPSAISETALWACAIIKIMHTIAHMDKDLRSTYFTDIQKQILDRFYRFIHSDEKNQVYLGKDARDLDRVDLISFDSKPKKARDSVLLKLLHKPENVAEDIFDRVGIRFVTKNKLDCLRVVKFLKERYVIMPANIKPSRSRNTLFDTQSFSAEATKIVAMADRGELSVQELQQKLVEFCENSASKRQEVDNPHTSKDYRGIQFTGRQLIKIKNPLFSDLKALKASIKGAPLPDEVAKIAERIDMGNIQKEIRFFYPFVVQVFVESSHQENLAGRSSHANYKKSQIQAAMRRVMGELVRFGGRTADDS